MKASPHLGFLQVARVAIVLLLLEAEHSSATSYTPVHLSECVAEAGIIAAGTVQSISSRMADGMIVSDIRFTKTVFLRDARVSRKDSLVLHVLGGTVGREQLEDVGGPEFRLNERYVLLLRTHLGTSKDAYTPVVFFNQGLFPVFADSGESEPSVHDWLRRPIAGVRGGRIITVEHGSLVENDRTLGSQPLARLSAVEIDSLAMDVDPRVPLIVIEHLRDPRIRLNEEQFLAELRELIQ
jgi:hypothetical protein